jgi:hypothetical protein
VKATWLWCWAVQQALQSISAQCWSHTISYVYIHIWGGRWRLNIRFQCVHHAGCEMCVGGWREIYMYAVYCVNDQKHFIHCQLQLPTGSSVIQWHSNAKRGFFPHSFILLFLSYFFLCWIQLLLFLDVAIFWGKSRKLAVIAHSLLFIFFTPPFFYFQVECVCKKKKKEGGIEEFSLSYKRDRSNTIIARMLSFLIFSFIFFLLCQLWSYRSYRDRLRSKTEKYKEKEKKKGTFKKAQENGRRKKEAERDRRRISLVRKDFRLRSRYRSSLEL